jgi:predicted Holliday junction resolvase-like endonuclease
MTIEQIFLEQGLTGAIILVLSGVIFYLYKQILRLRDQYNEVQEKRINYRTLERDCREKILTDALEQARKMELKDQELIMTLTETLRLLKEEIHAIGMSGTGTGSDPTK